MFFSSIRKFKLACHLAVTFIIRQRYYTRCGGSTSEYLTRLYEGQAFAPILALLFVIGAPIVTQAMHQQVFSEEQQVAQFVKADTTKEDKVLAIASDKNINLRSQRVGGIDDFPRHYPVRFHQNFDLLFANAGNKYVVVQSGQDLSDSVKETLKDSYKKWKLVMLVNFLYIKEIRYT